MSNQTTYDVFVSYAAADAPAVQPLITDLTHAGAHVYPWQIDKSLDDVMRRELENALRYSDYVVLVLSPNSIDNEWTQFAVGVRSTRLPAPNVIPVYLRLPQTRNKVISPGIAAIPGMSLDERPSRDIAERITAFVTADREAAVQRSESTARSPAPRWPALSVAVHRFFQISSTKLSRPQLATSAETERRRLLRIRRHLIG